jgi:hypothetical protein
VNSASDDSRAGVSPTTPGKIVSGARFDELLDRFSAVRGCAASALCCWIAAMAVSPNLEPRLLIRFATETEKPHLAEDRTL